MSEFKVHLELYTKFKKDAENKKLFEGTRVEAYFLATFHLIEACAAKERILINKHQNVRRAIEENEFIFKDESEAVWRNFQIIENQLRPKFAYSMSWSAVDVRKFYEHFQIIEKICLKVIGNV
ncbi:hypothetical protein HYV89_05555 [Candidatus Woesearchaeota archaeon]|nr:hypothetical protein [Candidatus Woesearchaeota archaeon]